MARFGRLTHAEARTLTRAELLERVTAEEASWSRKHTRTDADVPAEAEFSRIMHEDLKPVGMIRAARDVVGSRGSDYWETRPGGTDAEAGQ